MRRWNIGIIGGGPGGLMLAYRLQRFAQQPHAVTLFEASDRLGGKILTNRFSSAPVSYEAGAAELYDYSVVGEDPLRELIAELGLFTRPMGGATVVLRDQVLANADDLRENLGPEAWKTLQHFHQIARDRHSPAEFYYADGRETLQDPALGQAFNCYLARLPNDRVRQYVETLIHSDLATEPGRTNVAYGLQNYLMNDPAYMRLYTIDGGIERLPRELARRIDARVLLQHAAARVEAGDDGQLRVHTRHHGKTTTHEFDFVVVALPNHLLPHLEWGGSRLQAAIARHNRHYDHPAHYLRVSVLFDRPYWRRQINESFFMTDAFEGCCLYDESSRNGCEGHGVLGWLLGGEAARSHSSLSDEQLIKQALDSLPAFLKPPEGSFREGRVHRWISAVNAMPGGFPALPIDLRHQPEPVQHPNLLLVGDYLFDSTLNGVLDSAEFVAEWLAIEMEEHATRRPVRSRRLTPAPRAGHKLPAEVYS